MSRRLNLNFTGVESFSKASEGVHTAKVKEILEKTSQAGDQMLQVAFEIIKGDDQGCRVFESFVLNERALWKFKAFLTAIGIKADGKITIDLDKLIGKVCEIEVYHDEYNGQTRAKINDYYKVKSSSVEDEEEDDDEDYEEEEEVIEEPKKAKKGRPAKKKPEPEPEEDEDDDEDDEWEDDDE